MAKTKQQKRLLVIYLTICSAVVPLLIKVDSVSASRIPLDENGNMLQHLQQPQIDNNVQEHNYIMDQQKQIPTAVITQYSNILEGNGDDALKGKYFGDDLKEDELDLGHLFIPINMDKRAPDGYVGMRGKKLYDDGYNNINNDNYFYNLPWKHLQNSDENINWDEESTINVKRYKKTPTAFYGVRGKKFTTMDGGSSNTDNHRWHDFLQKFEEERIREVIFQNFVARLAGVKNDLTNDMTKGAPTGFGGARGKRPSLHEFEPSMQTANKKGLGNNAFVGVRGKKDVFHQPVIKRSSSSAEALRGRNGKRQRFVDFNNKFVAVRGKKSILYGIPEVNGFNNNESPLTTVDLLSDKCTPKRLLGMRGKLQFTTDGTEVTN